MTEQPPPAAASGEAAAEPFSPAPFPRAALWFLLAGVASMWLASAAHLFFWASVHPDEQLVHGHDNSRYFSTAHSMFFDGDLDLANQFERFAPESLNEFTPAGRVANKYGVGMPLMAAPAMLCARLLGLGGPDGMGWGTQSAFILWNAALAAAGIALAGWTAGRLLGGWAGALAALAMLPGSSALWYSMIEPTMAHAAGLFCGGLLFFAWSKRYAEGDLRLRWAALMGLAAGAGASVRMQDAPLVFAIGFAELSRLRKAGDLGGREGGFAAMGVSGACAVAGVFPHLLYSKLLWGSWLVNAYAHGGERFYWSDPASVPLLISTRNGLLFYAPLAALAVAGLALGTWTGKFGRRAGWALLASVALNFYVNAAWHAWWMGSSFGARGLLNCWAPMVFGLAALFEAAGRRPKAVRWGLALAVAACVGWTLLMFALYYSGAISHEDGFEPSELPGLVSQAFSRLGGKLAKFF